MNSSLKRTVGCVFPSIQYTLPKLLHSIRSLPGVQGLRNTYFYNEDRNANT